MTSLLSRLSKLFPESVPLEDLFTEAVARLFERKPDLCLAWLREEGAIPPAESENPSEEIVRVSSQRPFNSLEYHETASRPDLLIEVYGASEEDEATANVAMLESKIGSGEGEGQLRRYAEHLHGMPSFDSRTLLYVTRGYDPKEPEEILTGLDDQVSFKQLRWHDFYRFLDQAEPDALIEEVMAFMEENGMARGYRFSASDLMALSGVPRAFEIFDETLDSEVRAELESFAGNKMMRGSIENDLRRIRRYVIRAPLHPQRGIFCAVGYSMFTPGTYPAARVALVASPNAEGREMFISVMKEIASKEGWDGYILDNPSEWVQVSREPSLISLLSEEDHVAAVKQFFIESIHQLREELTAFKKEHPELPWNS